MEYDHGSGMEQPWGGSVVPRRFAAAPSRSRDAPRRSLRRPNDGHSATSRPALTIFIKQTNTIASAIRAPRWKYRKLKYRARNMNTYDTPDMENIDIYLALGLLQEIITKATTAQGPHTVLVIEKSVLLESLLVNAHAVDVPI
jgi:hypothetical protein